MTENAVKSQPRVPQPGEVVLSKYRVERVIGEGGMGVVLAIRHIELGELYAMKVLRPACAERDGASARFMREARAAARIRSDHVARVYDVGGLESGAPYMLMEHLAGLDLAAILAANGPLPPGDVVDYVGQALDAIGEAHSLGLVHRDLKPGNLFLSAKPSGATSLKVLDFGISKEMVVEEGLPSMTQSGDLVGSPYYMSPEQMRGARDVDTRADIWALGVIMFELLTDSVPFPGKTSTQVCSAVLEGELPSLSDIAPQVPDELVQIVSKCLRRERAERFESAEELESALARVPRTFDGSRSNRARKLVEAPRAASSRGRASLASITLTKSASVRKTQSGIGNALRESSVSLVDRRADPETTPCQSDGCEVSGASSAAIPTLERASAPGKAAIATGDVAPTGDGSPPSSGRTGPKSDIDSAPRASLPGVSELANDVVVEGRKTGRIASKGVWIGSMVAAMMAAAALVYVLLQKHGMQAETPAPTGESGVLAAISTTTPTSTPTATTPTPIQTAPATPIQTATSTQTATAPATSTPTAPASGFAATLPSASSSVPRTAQPISSAATPPKPRPAGSAKNAEGIYEGIY